MTYEIYKKDKGLKYDFINRFDTNYQINKSDIVEYDGLNYKVELVIVDALSHTIRLLCDVFSLKFL